MKETRREYVTTWFAVATSIWRIDECLGYQGRNRLEYVASTSIDFQTQVDYTDSRMITRLYANNFRCLLAFEAQFDPFGVLCGHNGAGKSSVFDALRLVRDLATGEGSLGGDGLRDIPSLDFTAWNSSTVQEFELNITVEDRVFEYLLHIEQINSDVKPRIIRERAKCNNKELYDRDLDGVKFVKASGLQSGFPLDWRQAALGSIQAIGERRDIGILQDALAKLLILRPFPRAIEQESKAEAQYPSLHLENLLSWYRYLSLEQEWTDALRESLQSVWPDFKSFRLVDVGRNVKALQLRFDRASDRTTTNLYFDQLSDGEKTLVGLYMVRAALEIGAAQTILIDEPDNYVGLSELQPWVLSLQELLDQDHQAILISHHPEVLNNVGENAGKYLWRDNHSSPTRIGPLKFPEGMRPGEAIARGWING